MREKKRHFFIKIKVEKIKFKNIELASAEIQVYVLLATNLLILFAVIKKVKRF